VLNLFTNLTCLAVGLYVVVVLVMLQRRERRKRSLSEYRNIAERQAIDTATTINHHQTMPLIAAHPQQHVFNAVRT
jgi:hypothetical protein